MSRRILLGGLLGGLASAAGVALTATSGWLIVSASARPVILTLLVAIVAVRTFGIARPALRYAERLVSHDAALADLQQRRVAAYRRLVPLTPARLGRRSRTDRLTGVVGDLDDQVDGQVRGVVPALSVSLAALLAVVLLSALLPGAGLVLVTACAVVALASWWGYRDELAGHSRELAARAAVARVAALVTVHSGEVQAVHARADAARLLQEAQSALVAATGTRARARARTSALTILALGLATVAVALLTPNSGLTGPVAALVVLTPVALADAAVVLPDAVGALARAAAATARLQALTDQQPAVTDHGTAAAPEGAIPLALRGVRASWDGTRSVGPFSLEVAAGEHLALVGPNGCGKSTLLALLARHLDPVAGEVEAAGRPLHSFGLDSWRSRVAVVDDEPHVFASSLRANLLLAAPHADDEEVADALRLAGLGGWLDGLPDGLDTMLGGHGRGVSGGERARLAVARALLSRRPVLLLDEPVAHLDSPTAAAVLADLLTASAGRTVIVATHRADGLDLVDRVVELGDRVRVAS